MLFGLTVRVVLIIGLIDAFPRMQHGTKWALFPDPKSGELVLVDLHPEEVSNVQYVINPDDVDFFLYTETENSKSTRVYIDDKEGLLKAGFNIKYQTKFIVHGFLSDSNSDTIQSIKDNLFKAHHEKYNIIAVDWSTYTKVYLEVKPKTAALGRLIGSFIDFLVGLGVRPGDVHCIGHSLGAHGCGFAGKSVSSGQIGRVTGLDPALPGFSMTDPAGRLDATDAAFVDCIHTCMGFLGVEEPICSADFYPNKGKNQPGCSWLDFGTCSHGRSHEFFAESILDDHIFPSLSCDSMVFSPDDCVFKGAMMGYPATDQYTGIFYTTTNAAYPFAKNWTQQAEGSHKN